MSRSEPKPSPNQFRSQALWFSLETGLSLSLLMAAPATAAGAVVSHVNLMAINFGRRFVLIINLMSCQKWLQIYVAIRRAKRHLARVIVNSQSQRSYGQLDTTGCSILLMRPFLSKRRGLAWPHIACAGMSSAWHVHEGVASVQRMQPPDVTIGNRQSFRGIVQKIRLMVKVG